METKTKQTNKKTIIGIVALIVAIIILAVLYFAFRAKPVEGSKSITIEVTGKSKETERYEVNTDAEFLRQAMEETKELTFSGTESEYGLMIDTMNGETADYNVDGSYWALYVNGEYGMYGIDQQPVINGDNYAFVYTAE